MGNRLLGIRISWSSKKHLPMFILCPMILSVIDGQKLRKTEAGTVKPLGLGEQTLPRSRSMSRTEKDPKPSMGLEWLHMQSHGCEMLRIKLGA